MQQNASPTGNRAEEGAEAEAQTPDVTPPNFLPGMPEVVAIQDGSLVLEVGIDEQGTVAVLVSFFSHSTTLCKARIVTPHILAR